MSEQTVTQQIRVRPVDGEHATGADDQQPDPRLVWAWFARAARPWAGWVLVALGVAALVVGYLGVSRQLLVAQQLPYLVSGGLVGIALVFLGGVAMLVDDLRHTAERLDAAERRNDARLERLETIVGDLRRLLVADPDAPPLPATGGGGELVALPGGTSYHRPDCRVVAGKVVEAVDAARPGDLTACKLCGPRAA